ncbi:MAG: type VI secretion system contractile sheath large subunit, partial [Bradyrhizobium sp.]|uniref:type VI secretion system contractile sheath large subunit n=1 Tax=Bradyrhizobium sp. TaxID=376 RepID=UPI001DDA9DF5
MATETVRSLDQQVQTQTQDADEFATLLKQSFKPRTERAATELDNAVKTLVEQALADTSLIKADVLDTIEEMIAQLDKKLSAQMNEILHAPEFQQIESAWRGLKYLAFQSETDAMLKIRVMNVSKNELYRHLRLYPNAAWDQSPLFKKVYEEEFGQLGGQPYGCLIGDYSFSHLPTDVQLLRDLSKIAGAAHAPFFAAADSTLMGMDSWNELMNPRDLSKLFDTPEYAAWKSLRDSDDARYVGLCMPRVLARLPYGAKTEPVEEFAFEEDTDGHKGEKYAWMNASYAMAANINRAFKEYGWCARIRGVQSGGEVEDLPTHTFPTDDGGVDMKCPTEIAISDRREAELAKSGLIPLI